MAFPPTATFGQLFPFQTSFEAKLFSSPKTVVVWLTRQQKPKTEMRTKATGLCAKSRRAVDGGVFRGCSFCISFLSSLRHPFCDLFLRIFALVFNWTKYFKHRKNEIS